MGRPHRGPTWVQPSGARPPCRRRGLLLPGPALARPHGFSRPLGRRLPLLGRRRPHCVLCPAGAHPCAGGSQRQAGKGVGPRSLGRTALLPGVGLREAWRLRAAFPHLAPRPRVPHAQRRVEDGATPAHQVAGRWCVTTGGDSLGGPPRRHGNPISRQPPQRWWGRGLAGGEASCSVLRWAGCRLPTSPGDPTQPGTRPPMLVAPAVHHRLIPGGRPGRGPWRCVARHTWTPRPSPHSTPPRRPPPASSPWGPSSLPPPFLPPVLRLLKLGHQLKLKKKNYQVELLNSCWIQAKYVTGPISQCWAGTS